MFLDLFIAILPSLPEKNYRTEDGNVAVAALASDTYLCFAIRRSWVRVLRLCLRLPNIIMYQFRL